MSFVRRRIDIRVQLNGDTFDNGTDTLELSYLRARCTIQSTIGGITPYQGQLAGTLWGLLPSDMAKLSTLGLTAGLYNKNSIWVYAGDNVSGMSLVFQGSIFSAFVDYNSMPDVPVNISASETQAIQLPKVAASSYKGSMNVATMLQGIANSVGLSFVNAGVSAVLSNHAVAGSAFNQIDDICRAALVNYDIRQNTLTIWPNGGNRDEVVIQLSSDTGMVGYPQYNAQGIEVVSEFNPDIQLGRQINVTSSIPKPGPNAPVTPVGTTTVGASGLFWAMDVVHDLAAELLNGPWFTNTKLSTINTQVRAA